MRVFRASLEQRWDELGKRIGVTRPNIWNEALHVIISKYAEEGRAYHTLTHIENGLNKVKLAKGFADLDVVETAFWFHDVRYDTKRHDNEEQSADFARRVLVNSGVSLDFANKVHSAILATKHNEVPEHADARAVVDIDLSSLGARRRVFRRNSRNIREEYRHHSDEKFRQGEIEVFRKFQRDPLYLLPAFQKRFGKRARRNIAGHLAELQR